MRAVRLAIVLASSATASAALLIHDVVQASQVSVQQLLLGGAGPRDADGGVREYSDQFDNWQPRFLDYLYVSVTNSLAFSPTDTMPLSRTAKILMVWESVVAFATLAVILARAVNVLT